LTRRRVLAWDGCINVRDLGGLPLEGGGETRSGVVVRADAIRTLTDAGWQSLADYGVKLAVDLRADDELADDPPRELPIQVLRMPIDARRAPPAFEWPSMEVSYRALLARFGRAFAAVATTVARNDDPVVVHCQGGRDRTGLACALMLRLAGVPLEAIAADHALSDTNWGPNNAKWVAAAPDADERERRRRVSQPAGRTMAELLAELDAREYLLAGGATGRDLDTLVLRLRP
jgi:protein-tyrosine phosphatase